MEDGATVLLYSLTALNTGSGSCLKADILMRNHVQTYNIVLHLSKCFWSLTRFI